VTRKNAEGSTRIHQKFLARLLIYKVKKTDRGDSTYTPLEA
jgi:hypothetical protein